MSHYILCEIPRIELVNTIFEILQCYFTEKCLHLGKVCI